MKKVIGLVFVAGLLAVGFFVFRGSEPVRIAANVVFNEAGKYRSPVGDSFVDVFENEQDKLKFVVYHQMKKGRSGQGPTTAFRSDSNWFMCWDSQERLWTYFAEDDLECCRKWYKTAEASGSMAVGEFGGWEGIPDAFFERLPKIVKDKYDIYMQK